MSKKTGLIGKKKGHLEIISEVGENFICKCDCGNVCEVPKYKVHKSIQTTCGCHIGVKNIFTKTCKACGKTFEGGTRA